MHLPSNCMLVRRDGIEIPIEDCVAPIHDREGQATGAVIVFRDVSAARAMALQMTHSAEHDFLTGLPNRMLLNDRIGQAIALAPRHRSKVAVLFLDLDGFKHINDSLGHRSATSCCNRSPSGWWLRARLRHGQPAGRRRVRRAAFGGGAVRRTPRSSRRRMLQAVAEAHSIDQHDLHVTTSIGVSVYPDDGADAETLIKNADTAMYQAKENGRQSYQFFKPAMNVRAVERQSIEEGLRRALERQRVRAALPAEGRPEDRRDHRRGGAAALDPPDAGPGPAGAVHSGRRGLRPHPADRRLGAARGLHAGPGAGWMQACR